MTTSSLCLDTIGFERNSAYIIEFSFIKLYGVSYPSTKPLQSIFSLKLNKKLQHCSKVFLGLPRAKITSLSSIIQAFLIWKFSISTFSLKINDQSELSPKPLFAAEQISNLLSLKLT